MIGRIINAAIVLLFLLSPVYAFDIDVTRVALNTGTGTQDVTFSNFSEDCTAVTCVVMAIVSDAVTDATVAARATIGIGFADGTTQVLMATQSDDAQSPANTERYETTGKMIGFPNDTIDIDFNAWLSNGVRIDVVSAPSSAYLTHFVIFGGSDISADVGTFQANASIDGTTDVTSVGFEADVVLFSSTRLSSFPQDINQRIHTMGVAINDGSSTQGAIGWHAEDNANPTSVNAATSTLYAAQQVDDGGLDTAIQIGSWDASGFTATTKVVGNAAQYAYLALKFTSANIALVDYSTPTSTGDDFVSIGFQPLFAMILGTLAQAYDTNEADSDGGSMMISTLTADAQYTINNADEDGQTTSDTQSYSDNIAIKMFQDDGTCAAGSCFTGTFSSFSASGINVNYSTVFSGASRQWLVLAIGESGRRRGSGILQ